MLHDEVEGKILHLEIVTNVTRYFLLRHIVSRHVIECILGPDNLKITFIGTEKRIGNALEEDTTTKYVFVAELHQRNSVVGW